MTMVMSISYPDYSLLIVVAAGMMKMATGDDSPLREGAERV